MGYNWGREQRRGTDRREARDAAYAGPERRVGQRRKVERDRGGKLQWLLIAAVLFVIVDLMFWHGYYAHQLSLALARESRSLQDATDLGWKIG